MLAIRACGDGDRSSINEIINAAAEAYRGVIPADRWHEPYMPLAELNDEIRAGVAFSVAEENARALGVMGMQDRDDVMLIRHAYVHPTAQGRGVGSALLQHLREHTSKPILIGTWAVASWAIQFYERHGFVVVSGSEKDRLLKRYWSIPERQIETSVVLADERWQKTAKEKSLESLGSE